MSLRKYVQDVQFIDPRAIPHDTLVKTCAVATVVVRALSYVFLRWIPTPLIPKIAFSLFAVFFPAFITLCLSKPLFKTQSDRSEITVTPHHDPALDGPAGSDDNMSTASNGSVTVEATRVKVMSRKKTPWWKTLFLGIPSPLDNPLLTLLTLLLNLAMMGAIYDLTWRPTTFHQSNDLSFARVGYVGPYTAKMLVREPKESIYVATDPSYVVSWKKVNTNVTSDPITKAYHKWFTTKQMAKFTEDTDYTSVVELTGLTPETTYRYLTTGNHTGTFTTAPLKGAKGKFTFLTSSCIKHRVPWKPFQHPLSVPGFKSLGKLLPELKASFMLFLGDFIYIDVPRRAGVDAEAYRMMYRQVYNSPDWPAVGTDLPWIHVLDDHEIENDWSKGETGLYTAAIEPFKNYQHSLNPPAVRPSVTYYTFNWGPASFFMLDTRRYRSPASEEDGPEKTMLGTNQLKDLLEWLKKDDKDIQWKIVVSSVPFTKNWQINGGDTWKGYQWERSKILESMWSVKHAGVVIFSGDRHEFAATSFPPPAYSLYPQSATVHEFSVSPLSQFYLPFQTYSQIDEQDVLLKYIPEGNEKFGAVEIDSTNGEQAVLKFRLFVNGVESWSWVLTAPVKIYKGEKGKTRF